MSKFVYKPLIEAESSLIEGFIYEVSHGSESQTWSAPRQFMRSTYYGMPGYVVFDNDRLIGLGIICKVFDMLPSYSHKSTVRVGEISRVVKRSYQKKKVGRTLCQLLETCTDDTDVLVSLQEPGNIGAVKSLLSMGWNDTGVHRIVNEFRNAKPGSLKNLMYKVLRNDNLVTTGRGTFPLLQNDEFIKRFIGQYK